MKSKYTAHYSLLLVVLVHIGALAAVLFAPQPVTPIEIISPTIQGVIVAVEPLEKPPEPLPTPPPPEPQKPIPKPKVPLPKAPPSERAVKQEAEPVRPTPPAPPVEQTPVREAPAPVTPPRADASQINNPAPVYPSLSKRLREEGTVVLEILVKADGSVGDIQLKNSSGHERLDEAALRAVKRWTFIPAKRGDKAIDFSYELPIEFSLNNK